MLTIETEQHLGCQPNALNESTKSQGQDKDIRIDLREAYYIIYFFSNNFYTISQRNIACQKLFKAAHNHPRSENYFKLAEKSDFDRLIQ